MTIAVDDYVYQRLDSAGGQIRLLSLSCVLERRNVSLRGTMKSYYIPLSTLPRAQRMKRMASLPVYQALSYVWGDPTLTHEIIVDGKTIKITANLYKALTDIQAASTYNGLIWSDAVCICQTDAEERSMQVLLMREIYQAASQVYIWLEIAPKDYDRQRTFQVMSTLCGSPCSFNWESASDPVVEANRGEVILSNITESLFKPAAKFVRAGVAFGQAVEDVGDMIIATSDEKAEIMSLEEATKLYQKLLTELDQWRPRERRLKRVTEVDLESAAGHIDKLITQEWTWFERSWVMQELGATGFPSIVTAGVQMLWRDFVRTAWYLSKLNAANQLQRSRVALIELEMIRRGFEYNKRQSLFNLIRASRHRQASDPRDKVFALIGLMGDKLTPYITPNYTIDVREVFAQATLHFIATTSSLDPICGWQTMGRAENLPTWAPDYTLNQDLATHPIDAMHLGKTLFSASGADWRGEYHGLDQQVLPDVWFELPVKGLLIDTVGSISGCFSAASLAECATLWLSTICSAPELVSTRTSLDVSTLEALVQATQKYAEVAESTQCLNASLNILGPQQLAIKPVIAPQKKTAGSFDASYVVTAFAHCLFAGQLQGNRLSASDVNTLTSLDPQLGSETDHDFVSAIVLSLEAGIRRRNIMVTRKGYIGTVREEVEVGDLLCVLFGCSVPVILRRLEKEGRYAFMGEAYAYEFMDAEAIVMQIKGDLKERDFILC